MMLEVKAFGTGQAFAGGKVLVEHLGSVPKEPAEASGVRVGACLAGVVGR